MKFSDDGKSPETQGVTFTDCDQYCSNKYENNIKGHWYTLDGIGMCLCGSGNFENVNKTHMDYILRMRKFENFGDSMFFCTRIY